MKQIRLLAEQGRIRVDLEDSPITHLVENRFALCVTGQLGK